MAKCLPLNETNIKPGPIGKRDNCVMLEGEVICIVTKLEGNDVLISELKIIGPLFKKPVDSRLVGIYKVLPAHINRVITRDEIMFKMLLVPNKNYFVAFKLLHT